MKRNTALLHTAQIFERIGFSLIPLRGKVPAKGITPSKFCRKLTPADFARPDVTGYGVFGRGENLAVLDIDNTETAPLPDILTGLGLPAAYKFISRTGRKNGGFHIFVLLTAGTFAAGQTTYLFTDSELQKSKKERGAALEIRRQNSYVVGPGSQYFEAGTPTNRHYEFLNGTPGPTDRLAEITDTQLQNLAEKLGLKTAGQKSETETSPAPAKPVKTYIPTGADISDFDILNISFDAALKSFSYVEGQRNNLLGTFAMFAARNGVNFENAENYLHLKTGYKNERSADVIGFERTVRRSYKSAVFGQNRAKTEICLRLKKRKEYGTAARAIFTPQTAEKPETEKVFNQILETEKNVFSLNLDRRYITDVKFQDANIYKFLDDNLFVCLVAFAGSGKTEMAFHYAKSRGKKLLLVVPYIVLRAQIGERFPEAFCLYGTEASDFEAAKNSDFIAITYDMLKNSDFLKMINPDEFLFVADEFHNFTTAQTYRDDAIQATFSASVFAGFWKTIFLSATPEKLIPKIYEFPTLQVFTEIPNSVNIYNVPLTSELLNAANSENGKNRKDLNRLDFYTYFIFKQLAEGHKVAVRINNTETLKKIEARLVGAGICFPNEISTIYNDENSEKASDDLVYLQENERVRPEAKVILCTSKLTDGSQIKNPDFTKLLLIDCENTFAFIQFCARFRNVEQLDSYHIARPKMQLPAYNRLSVIDLFSDCLAYAKDVAGAALKYAEKSGTAPDTALIENLEYFGKPLTFNIVKGAEVKTLACMAFARHKYNLDLSTADFIAEILDLAPNFRQCDMPDGYLNIGPADFSAEKESEKEKAKRSKECFEAVKVFAENEPRLFLAELHSQKNVNPAEKNLIEKLCNIVSTDAGRTVYLENKEMFDGSGKLAVKLQKRLLKMINFFPSPEKLGFEGAGFLKQLVNFAAESGEKWEKAFLPALLLELDRRGQNLGVYTAKIKAFKREIKSFEGCNALSTKDVRKKINTARWFKILAIKDNRKAGEYLRTLFSDVKTNRKTKEVSGFTPYKLADLLPFYTPEMFDAFIENILGKNGALFTENQEVIRNIKNRPALINDIFVVPVFEDKDAAFWQFLESEKEACPF